jgi:hypothetical protein
MIETGDSAPKAHQRILCHDVAATRRGICPFDSLKKATNMSSDSGARWPVVGWMAIAIAILIAAALVHNSSQSKAPNQRFVAMSRGQWKIPLETVQCLNRANQGKAFMIFGKNYYDDPAVTALFSKSFGGVPMSADDPNCKYVGFTAVSTFARAVRLHGQPALILASPYLCEGEAAQTIDSNRCSQKNVYFFQEKIEPLELLTIAFKAFIEPQDREWKVFRPDAADDKHEPCTPANTKSIFFQVESVPLDEPLMVKTTIVDLIRPEDWSRAKIDTSPLDNSLYAVGHVDKVLKGAVGRDTTVLFVDASVGRCVRPLKIGDTGILVGSANDVLGGIVRFFPRLNAGNWQVR